MKTQISRQAMILFFFFIFSHLSCFWMYFLHCQFLFPIFFSFHPFLFLDLPRSLFALKVTVVVAHVRKTGLFTFICIYFVMKNDGFDSDENRDLHNNLVLCYWTGFLCCPYLHATTAKTKQLFLLMFIAQTGKFLLGKISWWLWWNIYTFE